MHVEVNISNNQKEKNKNALHSGAESVTIRLKPEDIGGNDLIAVTKTQFNKLLKACEEEKAAMIRMSKTQIKHNMKIEGGFLPFIAGLAATALPILTSTVLPALATGALKGLASTGVNKL